MEFSIIIKCLLNLLNKNKYIFKANIFFKENLFEVLLRLSINNVIIIDKGKL